MALTVLGQNKAADGVAAAFPFVALYNGDPEGAGVEISGGTPAYARKSVTYPAASAGQVAATNVPITFDVPASTVTHWAAMSASTAGTMGAAGAFAASEVFAAQGTYNINTLTLNPLA